MYNVTIKVEHAIAASWLQWMKEEHMPQLIATGCFSGCSLFRLLEQDETDGITYCAQYTCNTMEDYQRYIDIHATTMRAITQERWGGRYIAFRSLMSLEA
jgi:hypothetical protein